MEWLTTSAILESLRDDREEAWQRLVERFHGPIVRFARRLGHSPTDADDLAQESLLALSNSCRTTILKQARGTALSCGQTGIVSCRVWTLVAAARKSEWNVTPG